MHVFPAFFGTKRPPLLSVLPAVALVEGGVAAIVVARPGGGAWALQDAGHIAVGVGLLWAGAMTGWWRGPAHMTRIAKRFAAILWPATMWLAVAGALELLFAARALGRGEAPSAVEADGVLHIVTIGVVLMLIVACRNSCSQSLPVNGSAAGRAGGAARRSGPRSRLP